MYLHKDTINRTPKRKPDSGRLQLDNPNKTLKIKVTYKNKKIPAAAKMGPFNTKFFL